MAYKVISFYRYHELTAPEKMKDFLSQLCEEQGIRGRILLGTEGVNGAVSGTEEAIMIFKEKLLADPYFFGLTFREQNCERIVYHKLVIRIREEICVFGEPVDLTNKGTYLPPQELQRWYDQKDDFVIVDARNDYEYDVGHFKDAVKLPIATFNQFARVAPKELAAYKEKKVVLYCTGGIRCEKASAYLKEQGFSDVYHVEGGIINYVNQFSDYWEGGLFVFDDRLVSEQVKTITLCVHCGKETQQMVNCHNLDCDELVMLCSSCQEGMNSCCSYACKNSPRQRAEEDSFVKLGYVKNYYGKVNVALVEVNKPLAEGMEIIIKGKTTHLTLTLNELRDAEGNTISEISQGEVTFPVTDRVRENDQILVKSPVL